MAGDHHAHADAHAHAHAHAHSANRPGTASRPIFPLPPKGQLRYAAGIEMAMWLFMFWGVRETYAVKLGLRFKFEKLGHPFEDGGLKGGKFGTWAHRIGLVKGGGDQRY